MASVVDIDPTSPTGRSDENARKRRRVPEEERKRVSVACYQCRRLKERCDGSRPCGRCQRTGRHCEEKPVEKRHSDAVRDDAERTSHLQRIAKHFLGDVPLDSTNLRRIAQNLDLSNGAASANDGADLDHLDLGEKFTVKPVAQNVAHYSGEFSHWSFSQRLRNQVDERPDQPAGASARGVLEYWRAKPLLSPDRIVIDVIRNLPPKAVALFLVDIYFQYSATNTFFVERPWLTDKLEIAYSGHERICVDDAPWVCTLVSVLGVGSQFVHMAARTSANGAMEQVKDYKHDVGVSLYHLATKLLPDVIALASVDSVQACLMLSHVTLPCDTPGLAYTYLGLALKMAIQNGMHRKYTAGLDHQAVRLRERLWWTAYCLEKRISIFHGRPASITQADSDMEQPAEPTSDFQSCAAREIIMIRLTMWLGDFAALVHLLRRCPKRLRQAYFERLTLMCSQYESWWSTLPYTQDGLAEISLQERRFIHLRLCYHLNLVFLGRPFIFSRPKGVGTNRLAKAGTVPGLVQKAVNSATETVRLCAKLDSTCGLAQASYIEFSSCRAAILVLLAQLLNEDNDAVRETISEGMIYLHTMAVSIESARSEASVIDAIFRQLEAKRGRSVDINEANTAENAQSGYESFKVWASMLQPESSSVTSEANMPDGMFGSAQNDVFDLVWSPFDASILDSQSYTLSPSELASFEASLSQANTQFEP